MSSDADTVCALKTFKNIWVSHAWVTHPPHLFQMWTSIALYYVDSLIHAYIQVTWKPSAYLSAANQVHMYD